MASALDDVRKSGHMIELYQGEASLLGFYAMVKEASCGWDGSEPLRTIRFS